MKKITLLLALALSVKCWAEAPIQLMPEGIALGESAESLDQKVPSGLKHKSNPNSNNYEIIEKKGENAGNWYYVRNGILSGYQSLARNPQGAGWVARINNSSEFQPQQSEIVLRLSRDGLAVIEVEARKWINPTDGLHLYVIENAQERTLIVFNPAHMSRSDFLIDKSQKAEIEKGLKSLRERLMTNPLDNR